MIVSTTLTIKMVRPERKAELEMTKTMGTLLSFFRYLERSLTYMNLASDISVIALMIWRKALGALLSHNP